MPVYGVQVRVLFWAREKGDNRKIVILVCFALGENSERDTVAKSFMQWTHGTLCRAEVSEVAQYRQFSLRIFISDYFLLKVSWRVRRATCSMNFFYVAFTPTLFLF